MYSSIRLFLSTLLVVGVIGFSVEQAAAQPTLPFGICYQIVGLAAEALDDPFSIAVEIIGDFNTTVLTATSKPFGTYVNLIDVTSGTRLINTRNDYSPIYSQVQYEVVALDAVHFDFADNKFYISNASQWFDGDGITVNISQPYPGTDAPEFPGKQFSFFYNLYRTSTYGGLVEDKTSGINLASATQSLAANGFQTVGWTGPTYTTGDCQPAPISGTNAQHSFSTTYPTTVSIDYTLYSLSTYVNQWNVTFSGAFLSDGNIYTDQFGDNYVQLASALAGSTRTYCIANTCSTVTVTGISAPGTFGFTDDNVYGYAPWLDYNGPSYHLSGTQPKPGYLFTAPLANFTGDVNIYVSHAGYFYEGFGVGGTGPQGDRDTTIPEPVTVTLSP